MVIILQCDSYIILPEIRDITEEGAKDENLTIPEELIPTNGSCHLFSGPATGEVLLYLKITSHPYLSQKV